MTVVQIKKEINKALEEVPEKLLVDFLLLINVVKTDASKQNLPKNLKKILSEDHDLLHKLAQ